MVSTVQHYEHLAMKFSSQADVYSHDRQRAWAEIRKLRVALERCLNFIENTEGEMGEELPCGDIAREALGLKP